MTYSQESMLLTTYTNISHQQNLSQIICLREMFKKGQNRREVRRATMTASAPAHLEEEHVEELAASSQIMGSLVLPD